MTAPSPVPPFADKTYSIVDGESDDIVEWATGADGEDTFVIKDAMIFQDKILPRFFNHSNYSSFTRQLNNYGFIKVRSPASSEAVAGTTRGGRLAAEVSWWEFKHPRFRRGRKDLLCEIKRREDKRATSSISPAAIERKSEAISDDSLGNIRRELDHVKRDVQRVDSKLDELKSMMMHLLVLLGQPPLEPRVFGREVPSRPGTVRVFGSTLDPSPERYTPKERRGYRGHQEWSEQGHTPGGKDTTPHHEGQQQPQLHQQRHPLQLPPPQQQDTRPLAGTDSRKRSLEEANTSAFHPTQRHGSVSHPVSVSEGSAQGSIGGHRESRVASELEEHRTNIPREGGAGDSTDDHDRGVEYGHWGRAWPRAAIADLEPSPHTRRLPLLRVPVCTSRPPTSPGRVPGVPVVGRDPLGPRTSEAVRGMDFGGGSSSFGSSGTERSRRLAHPPPWILPPLQSKLPQARLPLPRADSSNVPTSRESSVSGSALSDPEEREGSRPMGETRQQEQGPVADRGLNESAEASRRRSPVDDVHHQAGQWVRGGRPPSSS